MVRINSLSTELLDLDFRQTNSADFTKIDFDLKIDFF